MKNIDLSFIARVRLTGILASAEGNLGKLTALQAVFEKARFSESEQAEAANVTLSLTPDGWLVASSGTVPELVGKIKTISIEDGQAEVLAQELAINPSLRMADLVWVTKIQEALKGK